MKPSALVLAVSSFVLLASSGGAQRAGGAAPTSGPLSEWARKHGSTWRVQADPRGSEIRRLFNGKAAPSFRPVDDPGRFRLARGFLSEAHDLLGIDEETLIDDRALFLPLAQFGISDKTTVRFRQEVHGVPVSGGWVSVLLDREDNLLFIESGAVPHLRGFDVMPSVSARTAQTLAEHSLTAEHATEALSAGEPRLAILPRDRNGRREATLVWEVPISGGSTPSDHFEYTVQVLAKGSSEVIARMDTVHRYQGGGGGGGGPFTYKVKAKVTKGATHAIPWTADNPNDPEHVNPGPDGDDTLVTALLPNLYVWDNPNLTGAPIATTNQMGAFLAMPGQTVYVSYVGPYAELCPYANTPVSGTLPGDPCGNDAPKAFTLGSSLSLVMNPSYSEIEVAKANAYFRLNELRDWIREINPLDDTFDAHTPILKLRPYRPLQSAQGAERQLCNAAYWGSDNTITFSRAGFIGPCQGPGSGGFRTVQCADWDGAYAGTVWHETGHVMNAYYGRGNPAGGYSEPSAQIFAHYLQDDPLTSPSLSVGGDPADGCTNQLSIERNVDDDSDGELDFPFCGDCNLVCYGTGDKAVNDLSNVLWRIRKYLKASYGASLGGDMADSLLLGWFNAFPTSNQVTSAIEYQYLVLDDDDGLLGNGTPHPEVSQAFRDQGWPGLDAQSPNCTLGTFVLDFSTGDDFDNPGNPVLVNGQALSTPPEFGQLVAISHSCACSGAAVFDSSSTGPNSGPTARDPDLLVDSGNILILQEDPTQNVPGIFAFPDDAAGGGTISFECLVAETRPLSLDLIDLGPGGGQATVTLTDDQDRKRVYAVPSGWTTDVYSEGPPGGLTLFLDTLADQPGHQSTATATEYSGFNGSRVERIDVSFSGSGALDNLVLQVH